MTLTDKKVSELHSSETFSSLSCVKFLTAAMLSVVPQPVLPIQDIGPTIKHQRQPDTYQTISVSQSVGAIELFNAINVVYDRILAAQSDLEPDVKDILYSNLWDLYE